MHGMMGWEKIASFRYVPGSADMNVCTLAIGIGERRAPNQLQCIIMQTEQALSMWSQTASGSRR